MAKSRDKFELVFEAKEAASQKIRVLEKELAGLGGPKMVKSRQSINKLQRQIALLSTKAKKGTGIFSRFTKGIAVGNIMAAAATTAFRMLKDVLVGTIEAAAATKREWGMVTASLERHRLATDKNIVATRQFADSMQTLTGIADEEWGRAVQRLVDHGASLSVAFKLVASGADIAASRNKKLKTILDQLSDAIMKKDLVALKKWGVIVDESVTWAEQLDTAIDQLNANFGGAATDVADSYSVRMNLLKQSFGDMQEKIGAQVLPTLKALADLFTAFIGEFSNLVFGKQFNEQGDQIVSSSGTIIESLTNIRGHIKAWAQIAVASGRIIVNTFQVIVGAIKTVMSPLVDLSIAWSQIIRGQFGGAVNTIKDSLTNLKAEATGTNNQINELTDSVKMLTDGFIALNEPAQIVNDTIKSGAQAAADAISNLTVEIPQALEDITDDIGDTVTMTTKGMADTSRSASKFVAFSGQAMKASMGGVVDSMVNSMVTGRSMMGSIFTGMAQDFASFFIKKALAMMLNMFIPGLGSILGSIFDTPVNDRMAMRQGKHFAQFFTQGALAEMQSPTTNFPQRIVRAQPVINKTPNPSQLTTSSTLQLNVTFAGNVLSDEFIEQAVAPKIQQLINDGRSRIARIQENQTGDRDVILD